MMLRQVSAAGIVLVGWIPNCTSYQQSPDVYAFGPFKSIRDSCESKTFFGKKVGRIDKIRLAGEVLLFIFIPEYIFMFNHAYVDIHKCIHTRMLSYLKRCLLE